MHLTWFSRSKTFSTCDGKLQQEVTSCEKNGHSQCMDNLSLPWWTLVCVFRRVWSDPCGTLLEASKKMNRKMARATKAIVGGVRPKRLGHEDGFSCIRGCHFGREVLAIDGFYVFFPLLSVSCWTSSASRERVPYMRIPISSCTWTAPVK